MQLTWGYGIAATRTDDDHFQQNCDLMYVFVPVEELPADKPIRRPEIAGMYAIAQGTTWLVFHTIQPMALSA